MDSDDSDSDNNLPPLEVLLDAPDYEESSFDDILQRVQHNDPDTTVLEGNGSYERIQNMTDEEWEELGQDIANNTYLEKLLFNVGALNDQTISFFFRGLTRSRSSTIKNVQLYDNGLSVTGVQSMVPFLHSTNSLRELNTSHNNIQSEGLDTLFRALRDSPIETLSCNWCGIESIEIDSDYFPKHLKTLKLHGNNINNDGCRELAKLLHGANATLTNLWIDNNNIDDEGVAILVDSLQNNTSLETLDLENNGGITMKGKLLLLKLVCDISSIKATLQSNHTLKSISVVSSIKATLQSNHTSTYPYLDVNLTLTYLDVHNLRYLYMRYNNTDGLLDAADEVQMHINMATAINMWNQNNLEAAGREKMIQSQLHSKTRAVLAALQRVGHSVFSEIDPLHLPEVLSLIGRRYGQGGLFDALKTSIIGLLSTVNMKECIQQQRAYHAAKAAEHAAISS